MIGKEKVQTIFERLDGKCLQQFGFHIKDATFNKIVNYMYQPKDSSSLAVTRILFGLAMLFDIPDERGGATMVKRWGDPKMCHFPLFPILQPLSLPYMAVVYAALWLGALGIMLGYKYTVTAPMFTVCYWYLFLIEKSFWNNHSYLFGLVALLISCTEANCYWSLDAKLDPTKKKDTVPYWNYFILKYQFFILYFMAGVKKGTAEWLTGYSVQNLSEHWVFDPFKFFLTVPQTDYLVVHWFVFMFDLTVAIWMMWSYTRHVAMVFCAMFHLMNSRLFRIGMFPWVCLATMPLFYPFDWPKRVSTLAKTLHSRIKSCLKARVDKFKQDCICYYLASKIDDSDTENEINEVLKEKSKSYDSSDDFIESHTDKIQDDKVDHKTTETSKSDEDDDVFPEKEIEKETQEKRDVGRTDSSDDIPKKKITVFLIALYVLLQAFLPFSHFITKGYNNWTDGLYGYSWDMMVHTWDSSSVVVKVIDNDSKTEMYIDPKLHTPNDRWSKHGDMVYQYAQCLKRNIDRQATELDGDDPLQFSFKNVSIYVDVWCGMNGRFIQRMFDPKVDMLKASWSPFSKVPYLMPLLDDALHWRKDLDRIRQEVHSWSNYSDVVFFADFPGYDQEKFIQQDFTNVTLTILEGTVAFEPEVPYNKIGQSHKLSSKDEIKVTSGAFHKVLNIGQHPAFYMYSFFNKIDDKKEKDVTKSKLPILEELQRRFYDMILFGSTVVKNIFELFKYSRCN